MLANEILAREGLSAYVAISAGLSSASLERTQVAAVATLAEFLYVQPLLTISLDRVRLPDVEESIEHKAVGASI